MENQRRLESELSQARRQLEALFAHSSDLIFFVDAEGRMFEVNSAAGPMLRYSEAELLQMSYLDLVPEVNREELMQRFSNVLQGNAEQFETQLLDVDGQLVDVEVWGIPLVDQGAVVGVFGAARDISARKQIEATMREMAFHDDLTGLPNMRAMRQHVDELKRAELPFALIVLDIDRFKSVNDRWGHRAGDLLLQAVASRLGARLPDNARLFRYGGDELIGVLQSPDESEAIAFAEDLQGRFDEPFVARGTVLSLSASIGLAWFPADGVDLDVLFSRADNAMYAAKRSGRNTLTLARSLDRGRIEDQLDLELDFLEALRNGELTVAFQPVMTVDTGVLHGVETLARWHHPRFGDVSPEVFIPLAEECGLIVELGVFVLERACMQVARWRDEGLGDVRVSVNTSIHQYVHDDFPSTLQRVLRRYDVDPRRFVLEITESATAETSVVSSQLARLADLGVEIAIDDFGTGYSSLRYLREFPLDYLKIDRSFLSEKETSDVDRNLISTIIGLGHALGLRVVAEGVESGSQLAFLREQGAEFAQGTYFSGAMPGDALGSWLAQRDA